MIKKKREQALAFDKLVQAVRDEHRILDHYKPYKGLVQLLSKIPTGKQGIATHGWPGRQYNKLRLFGIDHCFKHHLILSSLGEAKRFLDEKPENELCIEAREREEEDFEPDNAIRHISKHLTGKHLPYLFERFIELTGTNAEMMIMVSDTVEDIESAQRVGIKTLYIKGIKSSLQAYHHAINDGVPTAISPDYAVQKGDIKALEEILL